MQQHKLDSGCMAVCIVSFWIPMVYGTQLRSGQRVSMRLQRWQCGPSDSMAAHLEMSVCLKWRFAVPLLIPLP